ncbi:Protein of unknown function [Gryllus bimaculatus]|nr:Protein of unknown function [Gryllus bimaculatus]
MPHGHCELEMTTFCCTPMIVYVIHIDRGSCGHAEGKRSETTKRYTSQCKFKFTAMGIKLPWFRARMTVKEGPVTNAQLVGTYSYKFDSYFDPNANSKPIPLEEKRDKAKNDALQNKKRLVNNNKNKSAEKIKSKNDSNSEKKISGKESSLKEHKTHQVQVSKAREKNTIDGNKRVVKKSKRAVTEDSDQHFLTPEEGIQQNTSNIINKENILIKTDEEKLLPEVGKTSRQFNPGSESCVCNETDSENQKNLQTDDEDGNLWSPHSSNDGTHQSLRERRLPDSNLEQLTIIIPDSSDESDEDLLSPALDDFHAYDEFDT